MYEKKEENSQYNKSVVRVNSSYINFYDKQNIKDQPVYHTFSIKVDNDFDYMKTSEKYVNGSTLVDGWSYGCQVLAKSIDFNAFMRLVERSASIYGNSFTYTLINEEDL